MLSILRKFTAKTAFQFTLRSQAVAIAIFLNAVCLYVSHLNCRPNEKICPIGKKFLTAQGVFALLTCVLKCLFWPSVPHRLYTVCKLYCNVFKFCLQGNIAEKPVFTCKFCPLPASTQNFENLCLLQEASSPVGYTRCANCIATCFNFVCKVTSAETPFFVC